MADNLPRKLVVIYLITFCFHESTGQLTSIFGSNGFLGSHRILQNRQSTTTNDPNNNYFNLTQVHRPSVFDSTHSNVSSLTDLEDPLYCGALTWNYGWIAVATNAFASSTTCCGRRVVGWKLFDDVLHELKGNPNAPPYCFFTKRLGSELVMKTLVATKCGLISRLRCGESNRFRCNYSTNRCIPIHPNEADRRPSIVPASVEAIEMN